MAVLVDSKHVEARHDFVYVDRESTGVPLSKAELKAAIVAVDQWLEDNKVSFNDALPAAAKANLTKKQKVKLLRFVAEKRWEVDA